MSRQSELAALGRVADTGALSNRNLIINGAFQIFQRASSATTVTDDNYVTADRVHFWEGTDGAYTSEQSTDAPDGFGYSMKLAVTTADTSLAAGQYAQFEMQKIEGQNLQSLAYGTNAAKDITLSFWVKSNKTGTYTVTFRKPDTTRYQNVQEYTIDSANTWEKKIITVSPDSNIKDSGGAIGNDTGEGLSLFFNLALGSTYNGATADTWSTNANHYGTTNQVNWMDSTSNELYITGVQLEVGDTATEFEHRSYGDEFARCQRYYQRWGAIQQFAAGVFFQADQVLGHVPYFCEMRAAPTFTTSSAAFCKVYKLGGTIQSTSGSFDIITTSSARLNIDLASSGTGGQGACAQTETGAYFEADAEL